MDFMDDQPIKEASELIEWCERNQQSFVKGENLILIPREDKIDNIAFKVYQC